MSDEQETKPLRNNGWGTHPSSLANLKPAFTKDNAKAMQLKGAESKRLKREQAEALEGYSRDVPAD